MHAQHHGLYPLHQNRATARKRAIESHRLQRPWNTADHLRKATCRNERSVSAGWGSRQHYFELLCQFGGQLVAGEFLPGHLVVLDQLLAGVSAPLQAILIRCQVCPAPAPLLHKAIGADASYQRCIYKQLVCKDVQDYSIAHDLAQESMLQYKGAVQSRVSTETIMQAGAPFSKTAGSDAASQDTCC